jgi:hypothetical protein
MGIIMSRPVLLGIAKQPRREKQRRVVSSPANLFYLHN